MEDGEMELELELVMEADEPRVSERQIVRGM